MTSPQTGSNDGQFPRTQWTQVVRARDGGDRTVADALSSLCSAYWRPVYVYIRRSGRSSHDAEDLTQGFFEDLLSRDFLKKVAEEKGKFRSFLLSSTKNFLAKDWRRRSAVKRGSGVVPLSLDYGEAEQSFQVHASDDLSPDRIFEQQWALSLLDAVLGGLEREYSNSGRGALFENLKGGLSAAGSSLSYAEIAERLGIREGSVKVAFHRLKRRYREALKTEVGRTLGEDEDVEAEISYLMTVFSR